MEEIKFKVRKATKGDARAIYLLGKKVHELGFSRKYPFHNLGEIREFLGARHENILFVAEVDGGIAGFIFAKVLSHSSGGWCLLDNLAVEPRYRHHRMADTMLHSLYREMRRRKVRYIQILEDAHQRRTREFWKRQGYRETKLFIWAEKETR